VLLVDELCRRVAVEDRKRSETNRVKESSMSERAPIWLTRKQLAERLGLPPKTLAEWASKGIGPRYARFGRHVRYSAQDILGWESERLIDPDARIDPDDQAGPDDRVA
jgi:excisionase family DNA binding protein